MHLAEQNGAAGVILYSDPKDYAAEGRNKVYPTSFWLPDTAIQSGTIMELIGDPTTPGYPSVGKVKYIPQITWTMANYNSLILTHG